MNASFRAMLWREAGKQKLVLELSELCCQRISAMNISLWWNPNHPVYNVNLISFSSTH